MRMLSVGSLPYKVNEEILRQSVKKVDIFFINNNSIFKITHKNILQNVIISCLNSDLTKIYKRDLIQSVFC